MEDFSFDLGEAKEIVVAVIAGIFGIIAAFIKRGGRGGETQGGGPPKNKAPMWLLVSVASVLLGAAMLAAENFKVNLNPDGGLSLKNPGAILCLAGSMLVGVGVVWTFVNFCRLFSAPAPKELDRPVTRRRSSL